MIRQHLNIKTISVNHAFAGRRRKTKEYKNFEVLFLSKTNKVKAPTGRLIVEIDFGLSSSRSDLDNVLKATIDCMQRRHDFNDNQIFKIVATKTLVDTGNDFIDYKIYKDK